MPIPDVPYAEQLKVIELVDRILIAKNLDPGANIATEKAEIDEIVCELYGLTDQQIAALGSQNR